MATMKSPRELTFCEADDVTHLAPFEFVRASRIEARDGAADPILAFKSINNSDGSVIV
jgi:hypothetical protein